MYSSTSPAALLPPGWTEDAGEQKIGRTRNRTVPRSPISSVRQAWHRGRRSCSPPGCSSHKSPRLLAGWSGQKDFSGQFVSTRPGRRPPQIVTRIGTPAAQTCSPLAATEIARLQRGPAANIQIRKGDRMPHASSTRRHAACGGLVSRLYTAGDRAVSTTTSVYPARGRGHAATRLLAVRLRRPAGRGRVSRGCGLARRQSVTADPPVR